MILGLLQARNSSTRLPGKVLKPIMEKPMLFCQIERVKRARLLDQLIVVTSDDASDDTLAIACEREGIRVFRGSLHDVLDRFYQAAFRAMPTHVVRLTGDCPLADPEIIDATIQKHLDGKFDYTSSSLEPTFPDGLDVEVMTFSALEQAWKDAKLQSEREHVTPYLYKGYPQASRFKIGLFKGDRDLSALRWTVDEPADFELIRTIYEGLYPSNPAFTTVEILRFLDEKPALSALNSKFERNEGLRKSIEKDKGAK